METYDKIKKTLAVAFMHDLDNNRPEGKMCLSNGECADIEKAFNEQDWPKLARYLDKYTESEDERIRKALVKQFGGCIKDAEFCHTGFTYAEITAWLEKQKEQKPVEDRGAVEPTPKQNYSGLTDFERAIHRGFLCAGVENVPVTIIKETAQDCLAQQKPAEWSEEDEKNMATMIEILNLYQRFYDGGIITSIDDRGGFLKRMIELSNWLKSLRPQPKQEWSEEDDVMFNTAKKIIWESEASDGTTNKVISWLGGKLRSLHHQPKQEWSVEDEKRYLSCLCRLGTGNPDQPETQNSKWFREHVSPHPHWKPSEEQIRAIIYLASSIPPNFLKEQEYTMRLVDEVIEQLKKL